MDGLAESEVLSDESHQKEESMIRVDAHCCSLTGLHFGLARVEPSSMEHRSNEEPHSGAYLQRGQTTANERLASSRL
ncbi:hypothetical protein KIN20_005367 [Parelaphostrongylus tenuis]|uniref:Uncharacterized protein n=1 Tax=Parelaphostrongylus tenuis TaxID=148309 RepID=A0AAD5MIG1_PARTN|nr:hypothetical protein KIN20_005367 [Parelaphostrongylus tenuis]